MDQSLDTFYSHNCGSTCLKKWPSPIQKNTLNLRIPHTLIVHLLFEIFISVFDKNSSTNHPSEKNSITFHDHIDFPDYANRSQTTIAIWSRDEDHHLTQIIENKTSVLSWCYLVASFPGKTTQQISG
jgi:hypothetical protein